MSREIKEDFNELKEFFRNYNLSHLESHTELISITSQQHKKYFSILTFLGELIEKKDSDILPSVNEIQIDYLTECVSDIGNSIFVMVHGAYKASRLMLRSSIENFIKGIGMDDIPDIHEEKSVYALFDRVGESAFFKSDLVKPAFDAIHNLYKDLCLDTHTATRVNMSHITAINYFPAYDQVSAMKTKDIALKLISNYILILCLKYKNHYSLMHHRNKENIIINIPKSFRPLILGIE